jgi:alcohol dehydrogenase class IV
MAFTETLSDLEPGFDFCIQTRIVFGPGRRGEVVRLLEQQKWSRIGVVVDHNLLSNGLIQSLLEQFKNQAKQVVVGACTISEPSYESLDVMRAQFADPGLQAIIGIGGGSALDMAKAMAVLVHNRQPAIHYRGFDRMTEPVLPVVAIPTTAGTGSEVTPNASFIDTKEKRKLGINGEAVRPKFAILDPELTLSCPVRPTVSAGVDSIVHATEALVAKKSNPMARLFAKEGFRRVFQNLPRVVASPHDLHPRTEVMYGAFLAGVALMNSGTGPAAAMSYPLGVLYGVPHGIGGAIFLPHVAAFNVRNGFVRYADLYDLIEGSETTRTPLEKAEGFVKRLMEVWAALAIPKDLDGFSIDARSFIEQTLLLKGALDQNPVAFGETEIAEILGRLKVK